MSKETPADDPRQKTDEGSLKQTDKPWKGRAITRRIWKSGRKPIPIEEEPMAVNKPVGDNARKGAVKKRTQLKTRLGGVSAWTKRDKTTGEFMALKKPAAKKKAAKKFKGARRET
jgi:hypothetical protein